MSSMIFTDQKALLQGRLKVVNEKIATKQLELQALQDEKAAVTLAFNDLKAAYQAWKGVPL